MSSSGPGGPDGEKAQHVSVRAHTIDASELHRSLILWGKENSRAFPWRHTGDPFAVLIAEMMLRRTQARQVVGVYASFIQRFPNARALAVASPEEVERSLYSLGLAWRVPAFQRLARVLVEEYEGGVPTSYEALVALPGVGDYVASAVLCFAYGLPAVIADTNTVRVAGRLFAIPTHAESRRRKDIRDLLHALLDRERPRQYNYALLDLAALVCTPRSPMCAQCPVSRYCVTGGARLSH